MHLLRKVFYIENKIKEKECEYYEWKIKKNGSTKDRVQRSTIIYCNNKK